MRGRTIPPLPNNLCGNLGLQAVQSIDANKTKDIGFDDLVCLVGEPIDKTIQDCSEVFSREDGGESIIIDPALRTNEIIISGDTNVLWFSDWSKFGFYDADFGWGNPIWASAGSMFADNIVVLMGNKEGDGIEAMVHLEQNYMPYFEQDEEIKSFCS
ncbi:hypothetical protein ACJIZ3_009112 [Penstemon smallii]|uniref:Uncharacterized protein n=1 Tax=Penstemon smallii TaxID=265156 RepID=A0ABD3TBK0_9LAMI